VTSTPPPPIEPQARRAVAFDSRPELEVIRVWPRPSCWRFIPEAGWQERRPWIHTRFADDPWPHRGEDDLPDLRSWVPRVEVLLEAVPRNVRKVLRPLEDGACWPVLKLVAAVPEIIALASDNLSLVALLALTAQAADAPDKTFDEVRTRLSGPRHQLLPLAGLPPSKTLLRVLKKLEPEALSRPGPEAVVELLRRPEPEVVKALRHLPAIRADLVQVLLAPELRRLCSYSLLADPDGPIRWGLHSALEEIVAVREYGRALRPAKFNSRREVADFCSVIQANLPQSWDPEDFTEDVDPPAGEHVLLGEPRINLRPLPSPAEVLEHGIRKKLCITTDAYYPECMREGHGAMYEVRWTDRAGCCREATAWLTWLLDRWGLDEVSGPSNREVPEWLVRRLKEWFPEMQPARAVGQAVEPGEAPELQLLLPLRWFPSPLDGPAVRRTTSAKRPLMAYDDWWETEAWLLDWQEL
jgi:hypothetical protein